MPLNGNHTLTNAGLNSNTRYEQKIMWDVNRTILLDSLVLSTSTFCFLTEIPWAHRSLWQGHLPVMGWELRAAGGLMLKRRPITRFALLGVGGGLVPDVVDLLGLLGRGGCCWHRWKFWCFWAWRWPTATRQGLRSGWPFTGRVGVLASTVSRRIYHQPNLVTAPHQFFFLFSNIVASWGFDDYKF